MKTACVRCGRIIEGRRPVCDECKASQPANERPYDSADWKRRSARFLRGKLCALCSRHGLSIPATVADHYPLTRKELLAQGIETPDEEKYLRPLCASCHSRYGRKTRMQFDNDPA
jgi:5-methylcytosine-specific restriction protein A